MGTTVSGASAEARRHWSRTGFERLEHPVEDAAMVMRMAIERRPEAATCGLSVTQKERA